MNKVLRLWNIRKVEEIELKYNDLVNEYMSNSFNDEVLDYSDFGIAHGTEKMYKAINYLKSKMNKVPDNQKVAQKIV